MAKTFDRLVQLKHVGSGDLVMGGFGDTPARPLVIDSILRCRAPGWVLVHFRCGRHAFCDGTTLVQLGRVL